MLGYTGPVRFTPWSMLRSARLWSGLSQQELADAVHASRKTIWSLESHRSTPSLSLALALARVLDYEVADLFER